MKSSRCPRCGGRLRIVEETWNRDDGVLIRSGKCSSCGGRFEIPVRGRAGRPPWDNALIKRSGVLQPLAISAIALIIFWFALRTLTFAGRIPVYRVIASVMERFLSPVSPAILAGVVVLIVALRRGGNRAFEPLRAVMAPDVHLRAEPPGKLSVVVGDGGGAFVKDFVVDRMPEEEARLLARFDELARRTSSFADSQVAPRERRHRARREEIQEISREIYALGLAIGERLLGSGPSGVADRLMDLTGDHLLLRIQPELAPIPWELTVARRGGQFLWQIFHLSRQLRDPSGPREAPARPRESGPLRMLLLANLEAGVWGRELPAAEREAGEILDLASRMPDIISVARRSPRTASELMTILAQGFEIIHYAGHASDARDGRVGWALPSGESFSPDEVDPGSMAGVELIFSNSCNSGPVTEWKGNRAGDLARAFMSVGVPAYLGTLWELHDWGSGDFAVEFYRAALSGFTLAAAVTRARARVMGVHPITWANYVLYGDPAGALRSRGFHGGLPEI